ncbi:hypothetical protein AURDEDRAFT_176857 [Auricularia subglabra TFB-10046 SS5]|uniref:MYND-type domain-containing protein n=1 Tax=Auricularia subglabra (strain TFB-10046 / SS5) TaxID=717982 RepID=J0WNW8_AURST|nr:hypothetical protein AURDEDRAFT_176857 [Auricularia subglabra TFB-10046 SS5]
MLTYDSINAEASRLASALSDATEPSACPLCLLDLSLALVDDPNARAELPRLRAECHEIFDTSMRTLLLPRTSADLRNLRARLALNRRRCNISTCVDDPEAPAPLDYMADFFGGLLHVADAGLSQGERSAVGRASMPHKPFSDKQRRWPSGAEQLLPYGGKAAVDALLDLDDRQFSGGGPFCILTCLFAVARELVLPPVLADANTRSRLLRIILRDLKHKHPGGGVETDVPFRNVLSFLSVVHHAPNAAPADGSALFAGYERALMPPLIAGLANLPAGGIERGILTSAIVHLYVSAGFPREVEIPAGVFEWMCSDTNDPDLSFGHLLGVVVLHLSRSRRCANLDCGMSELELGGRPFRMCSRCKVPRYCSKTCQQRDWNQRSGHPHKTVCRALCVVDAKACSSYPEIARFAESKYVDAARGLSPEDKHVLRGFVEATRRKFGFGNTHAP